jgi:hypothetical protein
MILQELLTTKIEPKDLKVVADDKYEYNVTAKIGNRTIRFHGSEAAGNPDGTEWHIEFYQEESRNAGSFKGFPRSIDKLTKSGKEFEVFSFVKQCVEHILKKHDPTFLTFSASKEEGEEGREKLYERLFRKYLPNYELTKRKLESPNKAIWFTLKKKGTK